MKDYEMMAANLYDGGWRASDKEQLISEYDLTLFEANEICDWLKLIEHWSVND